MEKIMKLVIFGGSSPPPPPPDLSVYLTSVADPRLVVYRIRTQNRGKKSSILLESIIKVSHKHK